MTDSNPHPVEPRQLTMVAALGWKLFPDPAAVAQLCDRVPDRRRNNALDWGAILLKHDRILGELASRALGIDADEERKRNEEIDTGVRKWHAAAKVGKLTSRDRWYRGNSLSRRLKRARAEDEKIARFIEAMTHELWAEARAGNWRVYGTDRETGRRVALDDAALSGRPPSRMAVRENRIGLLYDDVTFERVEEPAEGARVVGEDEAVMPSGAPGRPSSMHLVEGELERRVAAGITWPTKILAAEELLNWLKDNHPNAPRPTARTIVNRLRSKIPIPPKA